MTANMVMKKSIFQKSGLNSHFSGEYSSFRDYVNQMRDIVAATRLDLTDDRAEKIIDANSPFEWLPKSVTPSNEKNHTLSRGILLVHGLFDSPSTLLSVASYFHQHDFLVRAILLPGHGTKPGDLIDVSYHEWIKATHFGIQSFANQVKELYLCGFSTGGALVIHQSLANTITNLAGLIVFAPAIKLLTPIAILSNLDNLMHQTVGGIKWMTRSATPDYAKYISFTLNSAHQVHLLTSEISHLTKRQPLNAPILLVATEDDEVLSVKGMLSFFERYSHEHSQFILYGNSAVTYQDKRIKRIAAQYPEKGILNFSHMCLPIAPDHPHYGERGDYHDILYHEEESREKPKLTGEAFFLGALTRTNIRKHFVRRLTYNPDFPNLLSRINTFIKDTSHG